MSSATPDTVAGAESGTSSSDTPFPIVPKLSASRDVVASVTPHNDKMGSDLVTLLVGPDKVPFLVHKIRLMHRIPYFERMFNGHFREAIDQAGTFPEDDPAAFDLLLEWVYNFNQRKIREMIAVKDAAGDVSPSWQVYMRTDADAVSFYALAEKFMVPSVQDLIMGALRFQQAHNQLPSLSFIRRAYDETSEDSKIRLYAAHSLYFVMKQPDRQEELWPMAEISTIIQECDGACKDFLKLTVANELVDPRAMGICNFHVHGPVDICAVTGKRYGPGRMKSAGLAIAEKVLANAKEKRGQEESGGSSKKKRRVA